MVRVGQEVTLTALNQFDIKAGLREGMKATIKRIQPEMLLVSVPGWRGGHTSAPTQWFVGYDQIKEAAEPAPMIRCPCCYGRGYKPEPRRSGRGFYARTCRSCGGQGQRPPRTKAERKEAGCL